MFNMISFILQLPIKKLTNYEKTYVKMFDMILVSWYDTRNFT